MTKRILHDKDIKYDSELSIVNYTNFLGYHVCIDKGSNTLAMNEFYSILWDLL